MRQACLSAACFSCPRGTTSCCSDGSAPSVKAAASARIVASLKESDAPAMRRHVNAGNGGRCVAGGGEAAGAAEVPAVAGGGRSVGDVPVDCGVAAAGTAAADATSNSICGASRGFSATATSIASSALCCINAAQNALSPRSPKLLLERLSVRSCGNVPGRTPRSAKVSKLSSLIKSCDTLSTSSRSKMPLSAAKASASMPCLPM